MIIRIFTLTLLTVLAQSLEAQTAMEIIGRMQLQASKVRTMQFTMVMNERFDGQLVKSVSTFKINNKPFRVYMKQSTPQKGLEVLFVTGKNNGKAWVNTNGFPWVTLHLDPNSWTMRDGHHHSIYHSGFNYVLQVLDHLMTVFGDGAARMVSNEGIVVVGGRNCFRVKFTNPGFGYITYTVQPGENVLTIAEKKMVNEYMILDVNPEIDNFTDVTAGQKIKIPNHYAREIVMAIDQQTYLPQFVQILDDKGVFQEYNYNNLVVNVSFKESDFDPENPEYGF